MIILNEHLLRDSARRLEPCRFGCRPASIVYLVRASALYASDVANFDDVSQVRARALEHCLLWAKNGLMRRNKTSAWPFRLLAKLM
jgi:hypothetical protein